MALQMFMLCKAVSTKQSYILLALFACGEVIECIHNQLYQYYNLHIP